MTVDGGKRINIKDSKNKIDMSKRKNLMKKVVIAFAIIYAIAYIAFAIMLLNTGYFNVVVMAVFAFPFIYNFWFIKKKDISQLPDYFIALEITMTLLLAFLWFMWPNITNSICSQWDNPSCWTENSKGNE